MLAKFERLTDGQWKVIKDFLPFKRKCIVLEALKTFKYKAFDSVLKGHRITHEQNFKEYPPRTGKEATAKVKEWTGTELSVDEVLRFMHAIGMKPRKTGHVPAKADAIKQQLFLNEKLMPLLE